MRPHCADFTFAFDTTLIRLEMTEIWPENAAQAFSPPQELSAQRPPADMIVIALNILL